MRSRLIPTPGTPHNKSRGKTQKGFSASQIKPIDGGAREGSQAQSVPGNPPPSVLLTKFVQTLIDFTRCSFFDSRSFLNGPACATTAPACATTTCFRKSSSHASPKDWTRTEQNTDYANKHGLYREWLPSGLLVQNAKAAI